MVAEAMVPSVAEVMASRVAGRLRGLLDEPAGRLEERLLELDGWTLTTLLRVTRPAGPEAAPRRGASAAVHLGVVGVDHSLNRLVIEEPAGTRVVPRDLDDMDLTSLDDDDLIAAAHYVPETLPGYMLG
ncbi:MAG: hypothetical protein ACOC3J_06820 [Gemmatimonadota bacterium]